MMRNGHNVLALKHEEMLVDGRIIVEWISKEQAIGRD
jgi:hypothetical protein